MRRMIGSLIVAICAAMVFTTTPLASTSIQDDDLMEERQEAVEEAREASEIFREIMNIPSEERKVPKELLADAEVIAVFPDVVKAAFIFGGTGGKGLVSSRDPQTGRWGPPLFLKMGGASWGAQIGAQSADFILVGVNRDAQKVFTKEEWTLGADAAAVAGPVGRKASAGTDWKLNSQLLSYSRSKGLFAGISLEGAKIKIDEDRNRAVYGTAAPTDILMGRAKIVDDSVSGISTFPDTLAQYGRPMPDKTR